MIRDLTNGTYDFAAARQKYDSPYYTAEVLGWALKDAQEAATTIPWRNSYYLDDCCAIREAMGRREKEARKAARAAAKAAR